mgnify:CR=1 FL=1
MYADAILQPVLCFTNAADRAATQRTTAPGCSWSMTRR